ncbi:hypothetical protein POSPLADRAFT_1080969, partial [Postia placenta MAD-698-R-SB12]
STRELPSAFASPPLMPGLLASVHALLGAQARPTPIQALSLKHLFKRKLDAPANPNTDNAWLQALLAAETGSGKSMAYLLPMLQDLKLAELQDASGAAQRAKTHGLMGPRALVLAPTHELSRQLSGFAKGLLHNIKLRVLCVSNKNLPARESKSVTAAQMAKLADALVEGDDAAGPEMRKQLGEVDVAVGTPAKILEMVKGRNWDYVEPPEEEWPVDDRGHKVAPRQRHLGRPSMRLERVEWVVVDEADVLFDADFEQQTKTLLTAISEARGHPIDDHPATHRPSPETPAPLNYPYHLLLSTATIPSALAWYLDTHHPALTRLASPRLHHLPATLQTEYAAWTGGNRQADVEHRLRRVWHEDALRGSARRSKVLVFCNKNTRAQDLGRYLNEKGIATVALTSTSDARLHGSNHHLDGFLRPFRRGPAEKEGAAAALPPPSGEQEQAEAESADKAGWGDVSKHPHVLVTTSLLSRGLDFAPDIKHVFIVDEPRNMADFLHRAGRSGRAGEKGKVVVFGKT